jgi:cobalt-zinc-cadmium efflux system membrane fusion protein
MRATWVVAVCLAGSAYAAEIELNADQLRLLEIGTAPVVAAEDVRLRGLPAQIEIAAEAQRGVAAPFAGQVLSLRADVGDTLEAGAPLADLVSAEYAEANARLLQAQAITRRASAQAARDRELYAEGVIARTRMEASEADRQAARAGMVAEQSALADIASLGGGRYRLLAPQSGVVVARALQADAPVAAWSTAFVIADPTRLVAVIQVPATRATALRVGDAVRIGDADGKVARIGAVVDPQTQALALRATLEAPGSLRGGQRASAEIAVAAPAGALALPRAALWFEGNAAHVFAQGAPGRFREVPVEVLDQDRDRTVVRAELEAGTQVVTRGVAALKALREAP